MTWPPPRRRGHLETTVEDIERLYRSHGDLVLRRARAILRDEAEAQEVMQDLFVSLIERPERFRQESAPSTFLYAASTHRALRRLRDRKNRRRLLEEKMTPQGSPNAAPGTDDWILVRRVLNHVPEKLATVAVFRYLDGMTREEIGTCLGCSSRHVGNLLEKFNAHVRTLLGEETGTPPSAPAPTGNRIGALSETTDA